jgi:aspartate 1-decarboxylase
MASGVKLTIHYNGTIVVDGGTLQNADLVLNSGCQVIIMNNGRINMASGKTFNAPVGAIVDISHGTIN